MNLAIRAQRNLLSLAGNTTRISFTREDKPIKCSHIFDSSSAITDTTSMNSFKKRVLSSSKNFFKSNKMISKRRILFIKEARRTKEQEIDSFMSEFYQQIQNTQDPLWKKMEYFYKPYNLIEENEDFGLPDCTDSFKFDINSHLECSSSHGATYKQIHLYYTKHCFSKPRSFSRGKESSFWKFLKCVNSRLYKNLIDFTTKYQDVGLRELRTDSKSVSDAKFTKSHLEHVLKMNNTFFEKPQNSKYDKFDESDKLSLSIKTIDMIICDKSINSSLKVSADPRPSIINFFDSRKVINLNFSYENSASPDSISQTSEKKPFHKHMTHQRIKSHFNKNSYQKLDGFGETTLKPVRLFKRESQRATVFSKKRRNLFKKQSIRSQTSKRNSSKLFKIFHMQKLKRKSWKPKTATKISSHKPPKMQVIIEELCKPNVNSSDRIIKSSMMEYCSNVSIGSVSNMSESP